LICGKRSVARGPAGPTPEAPSVRKKPSLPAPAVKVISFASLVVVLIQACGIPLGDKSVLGQHLVDMTSAELHLPFNEVEPLLLSAVHMLRRPPAGCQIARETPGDPLK
jgi:hypothetical protein